MRDRIRGHVEIGGIVENLARLAAVHFMNAHGLFEEHAEMEELDRKTLLVRGIERVIGVVGDLAPGFVIDLAGDLRVRDRRRPIGLLDQPPRLLLQRLEGKGRRRAKFQGRARLRLGRGRADGAEGAGRGGGF